MKNFELIALIFTATALAGYVNHRFIRLPNAIGMMAVSLLLSLGLFFIGKLGGFDTAQAASLVARVDFSNILMHGMLSFLLFAGALHINLPDLRRVLSAVGILATGGVILAVFIIASLVWQSAAWVGVALPYEYALLFAALIAPTDPIAVLGILKDAKISRRVYMKIGGESLFNDGISIVLFTLILSMNTATAPPTVSDVALLFIREAGGGIALGLLTGLFVNLLIRSVDEYRVEVLLTLALVTGGHALAETLHVSAPIAMVVAGLIVGKQRKGPGAAATHKQLDAFWELLDEILNAVLFMLIGLQMVAITISWDALAFGLLVIPAVLIGRWMSVAILVGGMGLWQPFERGTITLLTWGGLRGGVSIALALSLPPGPERDLILAITYIIVVFSIIVQGTSVGRVARWVASSSADKNEKL